MSELSGFDYPHAASGCIAAQFAIPYPDASLRQIGALRGAGCDLVGPANRALNTLRVLHHSAHVSRAARS